MLSRPVIHDDLAPARPTRVRYQVLAAACSLAVITYIHRVGFATASAEFKNSLGLTDQHLGAMMAAFMVGYGLFEIPWGFLGDRFGVRNALAAIILGGSTLTAFLAFVVFLPRNTLRARVVPGGPPVSFRRVPGGDVSVNLADDGRLDADHGTRVGPGGDLDVEPHGRSTGAAPSGLALRRHG